MLGGSSSLYGGGGSQGFGLMGGASQSSSLYGGASNGSLLMGDGASSVMADIVSKAGSSTMTSAPVTTNLNQPYVPQSARQREAIRGNAPKQSAPAIADDLMQMLRAMPSRPTIQPQQGAAERKEAPEE
jgi:hypothetical protein